MRWRENRRRLAVALVASLALHGLLAYLMPQLFIHVGQRASLVTISFLRIEHRKAPQPPKHRLQPSPQPSARPTPGVRRAELAVITPKRHVAPVLGRHIITAPTTPRPQTIIATSPAPSASPVPSTSPSAVVASVQRENTTGMLPFGASQPTPILDPRVQKKLLALGVHVTLTIDVGDDGKTKHIHFAPPLTADVEAEITTMLSDARWDPSYCGAGFPCNGTATITL